MAAIVPSLFILSVFIISGTGIFARLHNVKSEEDSIVVTTIENIYGDTYDCIKVHKQPSLHHPLLRDHKVKMRPDRETLAKITYNINVEAENKNTHEYNVVKLWKSGVDGCPDGSVPIPIRTSYHSNKTTNDSSPMDNLNRSANSNSSFGKSNDDFPHGVYFAGLSTKPGNTFLGAGAWINVYQPKLPGDEYSSAAIFIESKASDTFNQIQVGWTYLNLFINFQVNPIFYRGDFRTRMYTKWTGDHGGCYNLACPGFVVTNQKTPIDFPLPKISVPEGQQYEIPFFVYLEPGHGWWLALGSFPQSVLGYWPLSLFSGLQNSANSLRFGGEVFTPSEKDFSPPMGSGKYVDDDHRICYMRQVKIMKLTSEVVDIDNSFASCVNYRCYLCGYNSYKNPDKGYEFLFGGSGGKSDICF